MNKITFKKQQGVTLLSLLIGICLIIVLTAGVVNVAPLFLENYSVKSSLVSLVDDVKSDPMVSEEEIKERLMKRLSFSNVENVSSDNIKLIRTVDATQIQVDYEVRTPFLGNIDFVVHFDDREDVPR